MSTQANSIESAERMICPSCLEPLVYYNVTDGVKRWEEWYCKGCDHSEAV